MSRPELPLTLGIEEEYLLVDKETGALADDPPNELLEECSRLLPELVRPEFLRAQIEIGTKVCANIAEAREQLSWLRSTVAEVSGKYGLAPIAASTHPWAAWSTQKHTDKERYNILAENMQALARRLLICGMHVHVGIEDANLRIDLMNQLGYFMPHLLALSTSSPFWQGHETGLKSYRLAVFDELPRTGLPPRFESHAEYERHVNIMVHAGLIPDATMLWWDLRPSAKFPTLEMRITDVCPLLEDAITIAALYQCLVNMLLRLRRNNQRWRIYSTLLVDENRWRAQRYGIEEGLVDFGRGEVIPFPQVIDEMLEAVAEDAEALGVVEEVQGSRRILERGTSAQRQRAVYTAALAAGQTPDQAMKAVVDHLVAETAGKSPLATAPGTEGA